MAFRSLTTTSDYDSYTKQYLANIALQIQLNQNNLNQNMAYLKTGVQETERPDSRSIEERAGDVEKLKVQARVMLNKISDPSNSNEVLDYLVKNGDLLFFFIQQFPSIETIVKEQFNGGIRAPLLISLIYKRFAAQQEESLLPESDDFQVVQNVLTQEDFDDIINTTSDPRKKVELRRLNKNLLPVKADIIRITSDPIKYQVELKSVADQYRDGLSREDLNKIIEAANDVPIQDTDQALLDAQNELFDKVNDYLASTTGGSKLQISPNPLPIDKPIKSRSSLARTIPKAPITAIGELKTSDIKKEEKGIKTEKISKKNKPNVLIELQQKQEQKLAQKQAQEAQKLAQKQSQQRAKLQADLIKETQKNNPSFFFLKNP